MSYPSYPDFGKSTRDFFLKGFQTGSIKLNIRDQVSKHINTTLSGTHNLESKEASGDFQGKMSCPVVPGFLSTTKWTTGNILTQELIKNDAFTPNLQLGAEGTWTIDTNALGGKLQAGYKHGMFTLDGAVEGGDSSSPLVGGSVVTGYQDFAIGYQTQLDADAVEFKKNNVALAYVKGPFSLYSSLDNAELLWGGLVYRHNADLEAGVTVTYKSDDSGFCVGGGAIKYVMDSCTAVKAKVIISHIFDNASLPRSKV